VLLFRVITELPDPSKKTTISVPEAAEVLGISPHLLYSLAKSDSSPIPILRFGKRYCVPTARLLEFLGHGPVHTTTPARSTEAVSRLAAGGVQGADLVAVIELQTAELRRVGDLLEQLVDQGFMPAPEPGGPFGGDPDELLDAEQAARLLGVTPSFVRSRPWGGSVELPRVHLGRMVRWRRGDLEEWIARGRRDGTDDPLAGYLVNREQRSAATRRLMRQRATITDEFVQRPQVRRHIAYAHDPKEVTDWPTLAAAKDHHDRLHRERKPQSTPHSHTRRRW
jgi:predicted DNA-binding transcriptional regulator AlpA